VSDTPFQLLLFTGVANNPEKADEWLEHFERNALFRGIEGDKKVQLFHLLMEDQAKIVAGGNAEQY
jgi:hypothetical protein